VLLAVFDDTQIGIQQKHQREGASSLFLKMTAKMFVKVQNHWADADARGDLFDNVMPVAFHDQAIVSPFGMPAYESLLDHVPEFAVSNYEMNMPKVRCRRRCRIKRETCTLQLELNNCSSDKDRSSKMKEPMQKLEGSSVRCEHRMMMKNSWAVPVLNND
jgi:hypothetical protein